MLTFVRKYRRILFLAAMSLAVAYGATTAVYAREHTCVLEDNGDTAVLVSCNGSNHHIENCDAIMNFWECTICTTTACQERADTACNWCNPYDD